MAGHVYSEALTTLHTAGPYCCLSQRQPDYSLVLGLGFSVLEALGWEQGFREQPCEDPGRSCACGLGTWHTDMSVSGDPCSLSSCFSAFQLVCAGDPKPAPGEEDQEDALPRRHRDTDATRLRRSSLATETGTVPE